MTHNSPRPKAAWKDEIPWCTDLKQAFGTSSTSARAFSKGNVSLALGQIAELDEEDCIIVCVDVGG